MITDVSLQCRHRFCCLVEANTFIRFSVADPPPWTDGGGAVDGTSGLDIIPLFRFYCWDKGSGPGLIRSGGLVQLSYLGTSNRRRLKREGIIEFCKSHHFLSFKFFGDFFFILVKLDDFPQLEIFWLRNTTSLDPGPKHLCNTSVTIPTMQAPFASHPISTQLQKPPPTLPYSQSGYQQPSSSSSYQQQQTTPIYPQSNGFQQAEFNQYYPPTTTSIQSGGQTYPPPTAAFGATPAPLPLRVPNGTQIYPGNAAPSAPQTEMLVSRDWSMY